MDFDCDGIFVNMAAYSRTCLDTAFTANEAVSTQVLLHR